MSETSDRTHAATPHRRRQALEQGHVARSHDFAVAGLTLCGVLAISLLGAGLVGSLIALLREQLGGEAWLTVDSGAVASHLAGLGLRLARAFLPLLAALMATTVLLHLMQSRFVLLPQRAWIDPRRLHPGEGWSRMFSVDSIVPALLGLVKLTSVGALTAWCVLDQHDALLSAATGDFAQLGPKLAGLIVETTLKIGGLLLVLGGLDFGFRWWRHEQSLRMTTEELRNEQRAQQSGSKFAFQRPERPANSVDASVVRIEG